jgi:two-component SAPR family response regulator
VARSRTTNTIEISTLGGLSVRIGGEPVTAFKSDKVRALLAYLAVEAGRSFRRETLAGMLWPGFTEGSARHNLRDALTNLRQILGDRQATPPFLLSSRQTIQFNPESDAWVDVKAFTDLVEPKDAIKEDNRRLEEAVELYQGVFWRDSRYPTAPPLRSGRCWKGNGSIGWPPALCANWPTAASSAVSIRTRCTTPDASWSWIPCWKGRTGR